LSDDAGGRAGWDRILEGRVTGIFSREVLLGVALSVMTFLTASTLSVLSTLGALFAPLPILYYALHYGRGTGLAILVLSLGITGGVLYLAGGYSAWYHLFYLGFLGVLLADVLQRGLSIEKTVTGTTLLFLGLGGLVLVTYSLFAGTGPLQVVRAYIENTLRDGLDLYIQMEGATGKADEFRDRMDEIGAVLLHLLPALVFVGTAFTVFLNLQAGQFFSRRNGRPYPVFEDLSRWRLPDPLVWVLILGGGALLVPVESLRWIGINLLIVFFFFYLFQGLAIVSFFFGKWHVPLFFRMMGYMLVFIHHVPLFAVGFLGVADVWADFRKIQKKPAPPS